MPVNDASLDSVVAFVLFLEFGFGFVQFVLNANRRTGHDRIDETIVVDVRKARQE